LTPEAQLYEGLGLRCTFQQAVHYSTFNCSIMAKIILVICFLTSFGIGQAQNNKDTRTQSFDAGWRFLKDTIQLCYSLFSDPVITGDQTPNGR
jgi:hypothetical protein